MRGPSGATQVTVADDATWGELRTMISEKTSVTDFDVKYGYPPTALNTDSISPDTKLADLDVKLDGEQLIIMPRNVQASLAAPMAGHAPNPTTVGSLPSLSSIAAPKHQPGDFASGPTKAEAKAAPLSLTKKANTLDSDPPEIPVPNLEGVLVLRVMPDDNSCLFRAVGGAVLGDALDAMNELRAIVAQTIQSQPDVYTTGLLEKTPDDYCAWIQRDDSWGGGIELSILSAYFNIEICSINVQDLRVDRFNDGQDRRCILVYSGIHYDVVALSPGAGLSPDGDRKVFDVARIEGMEDEDGGALEGARELCRVLQGRHYYTDTQGFDVRCNDCGWSGKGEKSAVAHATETGHYNFGEAS